MDGALQAGESEKRAVFTTSGIRTPVTWSRPECRSRSSDACSGTLSPRPRRVMRTWPTIRCVRQRIVSLQLWLPLDPASAADVVPLHRDRDT